MTLNWLHALSQIFTITNKTSCIPHFTLWQLSAAMHITMALPRHHKAVSDPDPHPPMDWHPVPASACPHPQGSAQCPGLGLPQCPKLLLAATPRGIPAAPSTPALRESPALTALWWFWAIFSGSLALLLLPAPCFLVHGHPCVMGTLYSWPMLISSFCHGSLQELVFPLSAGCHLIHTLAPSKAAPPLLTAVPSLPSGFLCEFLPSSSMISLSCLISPFPEATVSPIRQQRLLSSWSQLLPPAFPLPAAAAWGACPIIHQFYCPTSSPPALILGSFSPSSSIICLLKWQ